MKISRLHFLAGFTLIEFLISIGISVALIGGAVYGYKKFQRVHTAEVIKSDILSRHRLSENSLADDMHGAATLTGASNALYFPVSRLPSAGIAFNATDSFDGLVILKEAHSDITGGVSVVAPATGEAWFNVYYHIAPQPPLVDQFFRTAIQHKKYFFITNSNDPGLSAPTGKPTRNIIENLDYHSANAPNPVDCPNAAPGSCPNCPQCYVFRGGYKDATGTVMTLSSPNIQTFMNQFNSNDSNIRAGEKITYFAGGGSNSNCPSGTLCRMVDDNISTGNPVLDNLTQMRIQFQFNDVTPNEGNPNASGGLRSIYDTNYVNSVGSVANAVSFSQVGLVSISFDETLPSELANVLGQDTSDSALFKFENGKYKYNSAIQLRPGNGLASGIKFQAGSNLGTCSSLQTAQCNPSGECNSLFTDSDTNSPYSTKYRTDTPFPGDANLSVPSDYCTCGWNPTENRFYDPDAERTSLPWYNQATKDYFVGLTTGSYQGVWMTSNLIDLNRSNACARHLNCQGAEIQASNPTCELVGNGCFQTGVVASLFDPTTLATQSPVTALSQSDWTSLDATRDQALTSMLGDPSSTQDYELYCASPAVPATCDLYNHLRMGKAPMDTGVANTWQNFCACKTVQNYYDASHNVIASAATPIDTGLLDFDSLCRVPGALQTCSNTWDSTTRAWILNDATHPQGLPSRVSAELCSCRRNLAEDPSATIYQDFDHVVGSATIDPRLQYGDNQIISFSTPHNPPWHPFGSAAPTSWQWGDPWTRYAHQFFDYRVDNFTAITGGSAQVYGLPTAYSQAYNNAPNFTPAPANPNYPTPSGGKAGHTGIDLPIYAGNDQNTYNYGTQGDPAYLPLEVKKNLSYRSQVASVNIFHTAGPEHYDVDCGVSQVNLASSLNLPSIGGCMESSHPANSSPDTFATLTAAQRTTIVNALNANSPLWHYRFFCDTSCGVNDRYNPDPTTAFGTEANYVRSLIRAAAGETNQWAAWCRDLGWVPDGSGTGNLNAGDTSNGGH
ncbi:MAG: hypothetical protein JWQ35_1849 [Bacteriovoracaceae bacterium]|nr:hypothetical protein [Bacteriovoracaceae bacterium]